MQRHVLSRRPVFRGALAMLCSLILLAGCSGPKAPGESNFRKAIDAEIGRPLRVVVEELPRKLYGEVPGAFSPEAGGLVLRVQSRSSWPPAAAARSLMEDLEEAGIAEAVCRDRPFGSWFPTRYSVYLLKKEKQKGLEFERETAGSGYVFTVGRVSVGSIERWTEPADGDGVRMTTVEYTRTVADAPKWARRVLESAVEKEPERIRLVLTNRGWVAE